MSEISIILFEIAPTDRNGVIREYDARSELVGDRQSDSGAVTGSTFRLQYGHHNALSGPLKTLRRTSMTMPSGKIVGYEFGSVDDISFDIDWRLGRINRLGYRTGTVTTPELAFTYAGVAMPVSPQEVRPRTDLGLTFTGNKAVTGCVEGIVGLYPKSKRALAQSAAWFRNGAQTVMGAHRFRLVIGGAGSMPQMSRWLR